jgi:hypothetical protein
LEEGVASAAVGHEMCSVAAATMMNRQARYPTMFFPIGTTCLSMPEYFQVELQIMT